MVATQDLLRDGVEELVATGSPDAARQLAAYWRQHKSAAAAHFVVGAFESLQPQLVDCRLSILRSFTVEPLIPLLRASAYSAGIRLNVRLCDFNVYAQEILDPASALYASNPDVVILAVQTRDIDQFRNLIEFFRQHSDATLIVHNFELPAMTSLLDTQSVENETDAIIEANRALRRIVNEHRSVYVLDYDALVARYGRLNWSDPMKRVTMSLPMAPAHMIHLCDAWMHFLHPITGKIAKAAVVDLDDTLWRGILGEDGAEGIAMGTEYPGVLYREVQRALLDVRNRGIVLAIASKNDPQEAMNVLATHPDMLLRPEHFSAFRIGWQEKSQSIREIAAELNIGIDAIAFIDDNPVERERIANDLPEVYVVDLPNEPAGFAQAIRSYPAFERLSFSEEDRQRATYYNDEKRRDKLQRSCKSTEEFLESLRQVVEIRPAGPANIGRIAQLTQKTNQFNLTTRRYTEQEIAAMSGSDTADVFAMRVRDVYNDNGIVGVAILRHDGALCEIDSLLLSCRVIGRTVETALLAFVCEHAKNRGASTLKGRFIPTKKNAPAADFYPRHHFVRNGDEHSYELDLNQNTVRCPEWIRLQ